MEEDTKIPIKNFARATKNRSKTRKHRGLYMGQLLLLLLIMEARR